ncbi:hypothetical protein AOQ84DRAFT_359424 [Glonium stellatum]|uniref:Uncharacterized protein n=1 Tax=Glonium stellatum TaxID=574774 RepID=A0A8E2FAZ9_9PEZI|nr:hypothetical protein AOQ84DRAFT_359424 [Glonium stellatum]
MGNIYSGCSMCRDDKPIQVPPVPQEDSSKTPPVPQEDSSKTPPLGLTAANLAGHNIAMASQRSVPSHVTKQMTRVIELGRSLDIELSEQLLPGYYDGQTPMDRWLNS